MKKLLSGNEAISRGAYEGGVLFATGYPGTPSTEILETISQYKNIYSNWMANEKVALDAAFGASLAGVRALVSMKHVGLNVAADTLMSISYTGVGAGLVIVSADDPGMHSSQNEQDNRNYAKFAKIPLLEPSDSQEAKDFTVLAFKISEKFDVPVLLRITTRVAHTKSKVKLKKKQKITKFLASFPLDSSKYVLIPNFARKRRVFVEKRMKELEKFSNRIDCNRIEWRRSDQGVVTSGISYAYAKEVFPMFSILKLGMSYPLPKDLIRKLAQRVKVLYVIEESDSFLEQQIRALNLKIDIKGENIFSKIGELTPDKIACEKEKLKTETAVSIAGQNSRSQEALFCAGCAYLGIFYVLKKLNLTICGDIGCYALAAMPPLEAMHTCVSMGSGLGIALGMGKVSKGDLPSRLIAVIGDSTFLHSGMTALLSIAYNQGTNKIIILDNQTTAMTGGQDHPGTGNTLKRNKTAKTDYVRLVKALGIKKVSVIDSYNIQNTRKIITQSLKCSQPEVFIAKNPCSKRFRVEKNNQCEILTNRCIACKECLKLGCPAIILLRETKSLCIEKSLCIGCSLCRQICPVKAINQVR